MSRIRLIDFDQVTLSSLNRHSVATLADVGMPKVQCMYRRMIAVTPWVKFDIRQEKFDMDVADEMLSPWGEDGRKPDFVIDAIDNIETKVALLKYCHDKGLPVISSAGSGCKSDPTRMMEGDISATTDDPLSRSTRRRLKLQGVTSGVPVVYSVERTGEGKAELLPLPEEEYKKGSVGDLGALPNFRVRILPVLGTMPAVFGYTVANHVILSITGMYQCSLSPSISNTADKTRLPHKLPRAQDPREALRGRPLLPPRDRREARPRRRGFGPPRQRRPQAPRVPRRCHLPHRGTLPRPERRVGRADEAGARAVEEARGAGAEKDRGGCRRAEVGGD